MQATQAVLSVSVHRWLSQRTKASLAGVQQADAGRMLQNLIVHNSALRSARC